MSQMKKKSILLGLILALMSVFVFACKSETKVESIYFAEEQIVMVKGATYSPEVVVVPSYASNTSYLISSLDETIVKVSNNRLTAVEVGATHIKVVSKSDELKQSIIKVVVYESQMQLRSPNNLTYNEDTQTFTFDPVQNANGYIMQINNETISLGNTNQYSLKQYIEKTGAGYDQVLNVKVKSVSKYSWVYLDSEFSTSLKIYQASPVGDAKIQGGLLKFTKTNATNYDVKINNTLYKTVTESQINMNALPDIIENSTISINIVAKVDQAKKVDSSVKYYDALSYDIDSVDVLGTVNAGFTATGLSWEGVPHASHYAIYLDNQEDAMCVVDANEFDLYSLILPNRDSNYQVRVEPVLDSNSENVVKTVKKGNSVTFNVLPMPNVYAQNELVKWADVANAQDYNVSIIKPDGTNVQFVQRDVTLSLSSLPTGAKYTVNVQANSKNVAGILYLSSKVGSIEITKRADVDGVDIQDYKLYFNAVVGDKYDISIDVDGTVENEIKINSLVASDEIVEYDLKNDAYTAGEHKIVIKHLGNGSEIFNSNTTEHSFVQLVSVDELSIEQGVVTAEKPLANVDAVYKYVISGPKSLEIIKDEYQLNTTDESKEDYLPAGDYLVELYLIGDGSATFSPNSMSNVACASKQFTVLSAPEDLQVLDTAKQEFTCAQNTNATAYAVYQIKNDEANLIDTISTTSYSDFEITAQEVKEFAVQSLGDGSRYLDSKLSNSIKIGRLKAPNLNFDKSTGVISKANNNADELIDGYKLLFQGSSMDYDFATSFDGLVKGVNNFELSLLSAGKNDGVYYLDSASTKLQINKIDCTTSITTNTKNQLVIAPSNQDKEYNLQLTLTIGANDIVLNTNGNKLVDADHQLNYVYNDGSYYIDLLNNKYQPLIAEMTADFAVSVKFSDSNNLVVDSDESSSVEVYFEQATSLSRSQQYLSIDNSALKTYNDYALFIDDKDVVLLQGATGQDIINDAENLKIKVNINYIYNYLDLSNDGLHTVKVISLNTDPVRQTLSVVGQDVYVERIANLALTSTKNNEAVNNSVIVSFEVVDAPYDKSYTAYIYNKNDGNKTNLQTISFSDEVGIKSYALDQYDLTGIIYTSVVVNTEGEYTKQINGEEKTIYMFNSLNSQELVFEKINQVTDVYVNNGLLKFTAIPNAQGYDIYNADTYQKINANLVTTNSYRLPTDDGNLRLVIKSIARQKVASTSYTNSNFSDVIVINKLAKPVLSINQYGDVNVLLSKVAMQLVLDPTVDCQLVVLNNEQNVTIDLSKATINEEDNIITFTANTLLHYGVTELVLEQLTMYLNVDYLESTEDDVYYLDSEESTLQVYGLFAPDNFVKTSAVNASEVESVDTISWQESALNVLDLESVTSGYEFIVSYNGVDYYSKDQKLMYKSADGFSSYGDVISTAQITFPYGYDEDEDGVISQEEKFTSGLYELKVRALAKSSLTTNICASKYSNSYTFRIADIPEIYAVDGQMMWDADADAYDYLINVYQLNVDIPHGTYSFDWVDSTLTDGKTTFAFEGVAYDDYEGVYAVTIQMLSQKDNVVSSPISEMYYLYRLPKVKKISLDDGALSFEAVEFYESVEVVYTDTITKKDIKFTYDGPKSTFEYTGQESVTDLYLLYAKTLQFNKYIVGDDDMIAKLDPRRTYNVSIKLNGGSSNSSFVITSPIVASTTLNFTKLEQPNLTVDRGSITFEMLTAPTTEINSNFGNTQDVKSYWLNLLVYKCDLQIADNVYSFYLLDYNAFEAIKDSLTQGVDYYLADDKGDLYAYVKDTETGLYYNIYLNNKLDLKARSIYYYPMQAELEDGEFVYSQSGGLNMLNLTDGGSFRFTFTALGGDMKDDHGYLRSDLAESKIFVRYGRNDATSYAGMVKIQDLREKDKSNKYIDYPVYCLNIVNTAENALQVFLYYNDITEEQAKQITNNKDGIYCRIKEFAPDGSILFDLSQLLNEENYQYYFLDSSYRISVQTLAGLGVDNVDAANYLLDSIINNGSLFRKISSTNIVAKKGVLEFNQPYIEINGVKSYIKEFEITLHDQTANKNYVYTVTDLTDDLTITNNIVSYILPNSITVNGKQVEIDYTHTYDVKVRGITSDSLVLNANYPMDGEQQKSFEFTFAKGVEYTQIVDGMLEWKYLDGSIGNGVKIKISFNDGNGIIVKEFNEYGTYHSANGSYRYKFDDRYIINNNSCLLGSQFNDYTISVAVVGTNLVLSSQYKSVVAQRLNQVENASITTNDGILQWNKVQDAVSYTVTINGGANSYVYNVLQAEDDVVTLDLATTKTISNALLPVGNYSVVITAVGDEKITSIASRSITGFIRLAEITNPEIHEDYISWDSVENATQYGVKVVGMEEEIVTTNRWSAPRDLTGQFVIEIRAMGQGSDKKINSHVVLVEINTARPAPVGDIEFDEELFRYYWPVDNGFINTDKLIVSYDFQAYVNANSGLEKDAKTITELYNYNDNYFIKDGVRYYYLTLQELGEVTNFKVQVIRPNTLASTETMGENRTFHIFAYGKGTEENPYVISNVDELFNINLRNSAKYKLEYNIDLRSVNLMDRINQYNAIIADEFVGQLDGNNKSILLGSKTFTNVKQFALFNKLTGATIKNLNIDETNFVNTFDQTIPNMIKLSLIATGAINSTLINVSVSNFRLTVSSNLTSRGYIYIAGLVADANNTTVTDCYAQLALTFNVKANGVYIGSAVAVTKNCNITNTNVALDVLSSITNAYIATHVGGAVGYASCTNVDRSVISQITSVITLNGLRAQYIGGIVGLADYVSVTACSVSGNISRDDIAYDTSIGGIVGYGNNVYITASNTLQLNMQYTLSTAISADVNIGCVIGKASVDAGKSCLVEYDPALTSTNAKTINNFDGTITLGVAGYVGTGVTVSVS